MAPDARLGAGRGPARGRARRRNRSTGDENVSRRPGLTPRAQRRLRRVAATDESTVTAEPSSETEDEPEPRREEDGGRGRTVKAIGDSDGATRRVCRRLGPTSSRRGFSVILPSGRLFRGRGRGGRRARSWNVPLPWLRYQVDRVVFGAKAGEEEGEDRGGTRATPRASRETGEGRRSPGPRFRRARRRARQTLRGAVSVVSTSDSSRTPSLTDSDLDAFAESLDGATYPLDSSSAVARSSELAATAADAAIEKLAAALPPRTRATAPRRQRPGGRERWARGGRSERGHWVGGAPRPWRWRGNARRRRGKRSRRARASRSRDSKRRRRGRGEGEEIAALAKERLRLASRASRAAIAAAGAAPSVTAARTARRAEEETIAKSVTPEGAAAAPTAADAGSSVDKAPETRDMLSSVCASSAAAAMELSDALSHVTEWAKAHTEELPGNPTERNSRPRPGESVGSCSLRSEGGGAVPGPASPEDLRAARVACGLAAWIYYLPKRQNLNKVGLRVMCRASTRRKTTSC